METNTVARSRCIMEQTADTALSDVHTHGSSLNMLEAMLKSKEIDCLQCSLSVVLLCCLFVFLRYLRHLFRSLTENNTKSQSGWGWEGLQRPSDPTPCSSRDTWSTLPWTKTMSFLIACTLRKLVKANCLLLCTYEFWSNLFGFLFIFPLELICKPIIF